MHHYILKIINSIQTGLFKNKSLLRIQQLTIMRIYIINRNNFKYKIKLILKIIIEMMCCIYNKIKLIMVKLRKKMFLL